MGCELSGSMVAPTTGPLGNMSALSPTDIWTVVGTGGSVMRWNGVAS